MKLEDIKVPEGSKKKRKRVGCGPGSGHGKTSCKGHKGQNCRSGRKTYAWFEGGQMPLQRRVPKRGFTNIFKKTYEVINVKDLTRFDANVEIDPKSLVESGLVKKAASKIKLLGNGELDRAIKLTVHACSKSARELIEKAGGQVTLVK